MSEREIESKIAKWKIDYSKYVTNIINVGMNYLMYPFLVWIILKLNFMWNINDETFYSIWITLFLIRLFHTLVNPPKYRTALKV